MIWWARLIAPSVRSLPGVSLIKIFFQPGTNADSAVTNISNLAMANLRRLPPGERFAVFDHSAGHVGVDEYDTAGQLMWSHHYSSTDGVTYRRGSTPFRYVWPAELDLMARIAGLRLEHRWADWDRSPFTSASTKHVSVWRKPEQG